MNHFFKTFVSLFFCCFLVFDLGAQSEIPLNSDNNLNLGNVTKPSRVKARRVSFVKAFLEEQENILIIGSFVYY